MDNFKNNADKLLYDYGLLNELNNYGTAYIVGSYAMDLMAWNDLDIYVSNESMSTEKLYGLTSFILKEALIKSNVQIAPPNFSSDCQKRRRNADVFQGAFGKNDGKYRCKMRVQPAGVIYSVVP